MLYSLFDLILIDCCLGASCLPHGLLLHRQPLLDPIATAQPNKRFTKDDAARCLGPRNDSSSHSHNFNIERGRKTINFQESFESWNIGSTRQKWCWAWCTRLPAIGTSSRTCCHGGRPRQALQLQPLCGIHQPLLPADSVSPTSTIEAVTITSTQLNIHQIH